MSRIYIESKPAQDSIFDHLYLVFQDDAGLEFVIRGGVFTGETTLVLEINEPIERSSDARGTLTPSSRGQVELNLGGRSADDVWTVMRQQAEDINAMQFPYQRLDQNSNSVVASILRTVGFDVEDDFPYPTNTNSIFVVAEDEFLSFARSLSGSPGSDQIVGWTLGDDLQGGAGDDSITGEGGSDHLDGGVGQDTAIYRGKGSDYSIEFLADGSVRVIDDESDRDGTDTLVGIEYARFSDRTVSLRAGQDIAFVIDTTGSMWDDIGQVKDSAEQIIEAVFDVDRDLLNSRIAVVGYNDPFTETILRFTDQANPEDRKRAALDAIDRIDVDGGGDIPELTYSGLLRALDGRAGIWRSDAVARKIVLFGDATAKDGSLAARVFELAADLSVETPRPMALSMQTVSDSISVISLSLSTIDAASGEVVAMPVQIFTVLVGGDPFAGAEFAAIAQAGGGSSFRATSAGDVVSALLAVINLPIYGIVGNPSTVAEGDRGTRAITFTLTRDRAANAAVVSLALSGTADADDILGAPGQVAFAPGETSKTFVVAVKGDTEVEPDESLTVSISGVSEPATFGGTSAIVVIVSDDEATVDDYPATTATAGVVGVNLIGSVGSVETNGDLDYFKVSLVAGVTYTFRVDALAIDGLADPFLQLLDRDALAITSNDNGGGGTAARIVFMPAVSGIHYLGVRDAGIGTGSYRVSATAPVDTAPRLLSSTPADGATGVAVWANIQLIFDEPVQLGVGNIVIYHADGRVAHNIAVTDTARVAVAGASLTIDPPLDLMPDAGYYITVPSSAIRDLAGNPFPGLMSSSVLDFTTTSDDFPATPVTTGVVTVNGGTSTGTIEVASDVDFFRVDLRAGRTYLFQLTGGANSPLADPFLRLYLANGDALTDLAADNDGGDGLDARIAYQSTVTGTHLLAVSGQGSSTGSYRLTAVVYDAVAPTLAFTSPQDNALGVPANANIALAFDESVQRGTGNVLIYLGDGTLARSIPITDTGLVGIAGSVVTIDPGNDLTSGASYYVVVGPGVIKDLAGNSFAGIAGNTAMNFAVNRSGNAAPVATDGHWTLAEDGTLSGTLPAAIDADHDAVTYTLETQAARGEVSVAAAGTFSYRPVADYAGDDSFQFRVSDSFGGTSVYTGGVRVTPVNDAPVLMLQLPLQRTMEGSAYSLVLPVSTFVDVDNPELTYSISLSSGAALPAWLRFNASTHTLGGVAPRGSASVLVLQLIASDGALSTGYTFELEVAVAPNLAPTASSLTLSVAEDGEISGSLPVASDGNGDPISYAAANAAVHGSLQVLSDGRYAYRPATNFNGADSFRYSVSDTYGGANQYTVNITVISVNDSPGGGVTVSGHARVGEVLSAAQTASDPDGLGELTYQWLRGGAPIVGANGVNYALVAADVGQSISVRLSWTDGGGTAEALTSAATAPVLAPVNLIAGSSGDDVLTGTSGADSIVAFAGNDLLNGGAGSDTLDGGEGFDVAAFGLAASSSAINANLLTGVVTQGADADTLRGIEAILATAAADSIRGLDNADTKRGETIRGGQGNDTIDGGAGVDAAEYVGVRAGYTVARVGNQITVRDDNSVDGSDGTDVLTNIERLVFADRMLAFGTRAEEVARVAFVLWTPAIVGSTTLFARGFSYYDNGGYDFATMCSAALMFHQEQGLGFAQKLKANMSATTKTVDEIFAIMNAAPNAEAGRLAALIDMTNDSATEAAIVASGIRTNGIVVDLLVEGFGALFALLHGG